MITVKRKLYQKVGQRGQQRIDTEAPAVVAEGRVPSVSRLMPLAIRFEGLIRDGCGS